MRSAFFGLAVAIAAMTAEADIVARAAQCGRTDRPDARPVRHGIHRRSGVDVAHFACIWSPPFMPSVTVVEYHDTLHDRYFMTADRAEQAAIDAGSAAPQWARTGYTFVADLYADGCGTLAPVYRFTGVPDIGPASHFFTSSTTECALVRDRADRQWMFEGVAFGALPFADGCPDGVPPALMSRKTVALYRAYNNGAGGTPNHRFSIERAVIDAMVAQGWTDEGAVMCVYAP